jgi:thiol-disulfide isomerase/thioredoxin
MAKQIGEETKVTLDLKTLGLIGAGVFSLAAMWFALQADIALAKELPEPVIDRIEYDLKDELIRQTILDTQEDKINVKQAFGDDNNLPVVVEFWAKFNETNCFGEWEMLKDAVYYRVDIAKAPEAKKKYRVRMAPTIILFKDGIRETVWKAGLDLELPTDLKEIQQAINEVNQASKF